jgi:hypothetical protein
VSGVKSGNCCTHFSLLAMPEGASPLRLNHACDADVATMSDLFAPARALSLPRPRPPGSSRR